MYSVLFNRLHILQSGQQEDAEEFLGFLLDTIEEELMSMRNSAALEMQSVVKTVSPVDETFQRNGWVEVGKKNKAVMGKSVSKAVPTHLFREYHEASNTSRSRTILQSPKFSAVNFVRH